MEHLPNAPPGGAAKGCCMERNVSKCVRNRERTQAYNKKGRERMRTLKLCITAVVCLGIASSAMAISYRPAYAGYSGPVKWNIQNWDMGPIYTVTPPVSGSDTYVGEGTLDGLSQIAPPGTKYGDEDLWGIFKVEQIIKDDGSGDVLWNDGDQTLELVGMFYGGTDNALVQHSDGSQEIIASGVNVYAVEQASGTLSTAARAAGSSGRIDADSFKGIGTDAAGVAVPHTVVLELVTVVGAPDGGTGSTANEFYADFTPSGNTGSGQGIAYLDVVGGTWQYLPPYSYEVDDTYWGVTDADMQFLWTSSPNPQNPGQNPFGDWTVTTDDPWQGYAIVPEPVTMISLFGAFAALGGYVRRRRRA